jgi:hypothetical protein
MEQAQHRRCGRDERITAVKLIVLALEEVHSNQGLPNPDIEAGEKKVASFKELVMRYAENTSISESTIEEMLEVPLSMLADELVKG